MSTCIFPAPPHRVFCSSGRLSITTQYSRPVHMLGLVTVLAACSAGSMDSTAASEVSEAPIAADHLLRAALKARPANFPNDHVRAALAWVDGRPLDGPETKSPDDLRELRFEQSSDVAVEVRFPLEVRIPVEPLEPMHYQWLSFLKVPDSVRSLGAVQDDRHVNSLPHAEVVLYHDGNHNQRLDLLEPGEPGPGADRVLALSSGRTDGGDATRHVVVNRVAPIEPPLELFVKNWGDQRADGLYVVHITVPRELTLAQEGLLTTHGITMSSTFDVYWVRNMAERDFVYEVEPLVAAAHVPLFPVSAEQKSWLARGCKPYPLGRLGYAKAPPEGAAVHCGADRLTYASNPDDYCGQGDTLIRADWQGDPDLSWWPCDERGLKSGTPYVPSEQPLGTSVLSLRTGQAYTGVAYYEPPRDFRCHPDVIYDFDDDPGTHLPAHAPPEGSQVKCYGRDALSFIPPDPQCQRKFTYDLSSRNIPGYPREGRAQWDLREDPPEWWPCDAEGNLRAQTSYVAPKPQPDAVRCPDAPPETAPSGSYPPPPHSQIRCTSAHSLIAVPLWSDRCDGRTELKLSGEAQSAPVERAGWEHPVPDGWPCDAEGKLVESSGYEAL